MLGELAPIAWQAGGVFGLVLLAVVIAWWVHIRDCSKFRKEVRDGMAGIKDEMREDMGDLKTDMVERTTKLDGKIDTIVAVVTRMEKNGNGSTGCGARKGAGTKRTARKGRAKTTKRRT